MESGVYILYDKNIISVVFGGRIGLALSERNGYKSLGLQQLDKKYNVGESIKEKWNRYKPSVNLLFDNEKSIDILIEALDKLKENFNKME